MGLASVPSVTFPSVMLFRKSPVTILEPPQGTLVKIQDDNDNIFSVKLDSLKPLSTHIPRSLTVAKLTPEVEPFVEYLRTAEAGTKIYLEARNPKMEYAVREQYRKMTGESLVEGAGYNVAPDTARKEGCEGGVTFRMPSDESIIPADVKAMMVQRPGFINRISFVWMLIEQGFRVTR